jgi:hypothetical protein
MALEHDITSALDKLAAVELTDAEATALTAVLSTGDSPTDEVTGFVLDGSRTGWIEIIRARGTRWKVEEGEAAFRQPGTGWKVEEGIS